MTNFFVKVWHGIEDVPKFLLKITGFLSKAIKVEQDVQAVIPTVGSELGTLLSDVTDITVTSGEDAETFIPLLGAFSIALAGAVEAKGLNYMEDAALLQAIENIAAKYTAFANVAPKIGKLLTDGSKFVATIKAGMEQIEGDVEGKTQVLSGTPIVQGTGTIS